MMMDDGVRVLPKKKDDDGNKTEQQENRRPCKNERPNRTPATIYRNRNMIRGPDIYHSNAEPDLPSATSCFHCPRQACMFARSFLSAMAFSIHESKAFSSSGRKNDESSERTVSKLADSDVMWSARGNPVRSSQH